MANVNGTVNSSGGVSQGSGFTSTRLEEGVYKIDFTSGTFSDSPVFVATPVTKENYVCAASIWDRSYAAVTINISNMSGDLKDFAFCFTATGS